MSVLQLEKSLIRKSGTKFVPKMITLDLKRFNSMSTIVLDDRIGLDFLVAGQGRIFAITNISCYILDFKAWAKWKR